MAIDILSDLVITKVYSVSTLYTPEKTKLRKNDRQQWAVVIKYEGETLYSSCEKRFVSDSNHVIILPKGCSYEWICSQSGHFSIIEFQCATTFNAPISIRINHSDKILQMMKELEFKRNLSQPNIEMESIRDLYSIILAILQHTKQSYAPLEKKKKIEQALEYVSQNYNKSITNEELATICNMSTVYFRKLFTSIMGVPPILYVHRLRIEKAKEMLATDYSSLSAVAQSLGYPSIYDFSRDFKKHTGMAPSKYAKH